MYLFEYKSRKAINSITKVKTGRFSNKSQNFDIFKFFSNNILFKGIFFISKQFFILNVKIMGFLSNRYVSVLWGLFIYLALSCVNIYFTLFVLWFTLEMFTFALTYWVLCKNVKIKEFLYSTFGEDFLVENMGNPGKKGVQAVVTAIVVTTTATTLDLAASYQMEATAVDTANSLVKQAHQDSVASAMKTLSPQLQATDELLKAARESLNASIKLGNSDSVRLQYEVSVQPIEKEKELIIGKIMEITKSQPEFQKLDVSKVKPRIALETMNFISENFPFQFKKV